MFEAARKIKNWEKKVEKEYLRYLGCTDGLLGTAKGNDAESIRAHTRRIRRDRKALQRFRKRY